MIPKKLKKGSHIRVIAPATSLGVIPNEQRNIAITRLNELGLDVSFSKNAEEVTSFGSSSIQGRVDDIHEAFLDPNVDGIITTLGGFNSNQLLSYINFEIIKNNPKILCGYSDITALSAAIYEKTGLVTYSGPHFTTFSMVKGIEYTIKHFRKCLMEDEAVTLSPSSHWSDDQWYLDQENRTFVENDGWLILQEGTAEGVIMGGNLCTLNLLQGTEYFPRIKNDFILFIEDDYMSIPETFDRDLQSLLHVPAIKEHIKAVVGGRFQTKSNMNMDQLKEIVKTKKELEKIPIIANVNFGHVSPIFTFPIGGTGSLLASKETLQLKIEKH
ncbi:LD-carboxypeptidase [Bacillus sp. BGMRC 2118]|nr:LD-carboxypeptidase [Bacillus sp. BGMRC 2118]